MSRRHYRFQLGDHVRTPYDGPNADPHQVTAKGLVGGSESYQLDYDTAWLPLRDLRGYYEDGTDGLAETHLGDGRRLVDIPGPPTGYRFAVDDGEGNFAAFTAFQEALVAMNAALQEAHERISKLEDAARAAADTDWVFPVGARVTADEGPDRQIMEVTRRYYDGAGTRMYELDNWLCLSDDVIGEQGWETA